MTRRYCHPEAHNLSGKAFGCALTNRISELSLHNARPIPWHTHDETEVVCCIKGALTYEFDRRLSVTIPSGCFLVIPRGLCHRLANGIDGPCRRLSIYLNHRPLEANGISAFSAAEYRELLALLLKKRLRAQNFTSDTAANLDRIANSVVRENLSLLDKAKMRMFIAYALMDFATGKTSAPAKPQVRLVGEAVRWMESHYAEKITLAQLTTFMGYGKTRFIELFKQHTGLPPLEWLTRLRVEKACQLLKADNRTIADVARHVGFDDPVFFARTFRKHIGIPPSRFKIAIAHHG